MTSDDGVHFNNLRRISTDSVAGVMLKMGLRNQWIRGPMPLRMDYPRAVGRAFTMRFIPARETVEGAFQKKMPTNRDAKIRIGLKDKAAKDLYQHLAHIPFDGCGVAPGTRVRGTPNGKVVCVRSAKAEYWCSIAVDLKTGESVGAMVC